jgi:ketosteroid isomerase-like protein
MNTRIRTAIVLLLGIAGAFAAARPINSAPLSEAQKASIRKDVGETTRAWIQANERSDFAATMGLYVATRDFPLMYADRKGRLLDFEGLKQSAHEGFEGVLKYRVIIHKESLTVLDANTALWTFQGAWEGTLKTGARLKADACTITLLLQRQGKSWKIVFHHESYAPPTTLPPPEPAEKGM